MMGRGVCVSRERGPWGEDSLALLGWDVLCSLRAARHRRLGCAQTQLAWLCADAARSMAADGANCRPVVREWCVFLPAPQSWIFVGHAVVARASDCQRESLDAALWCLVALVPLLRD